MKTHTYDGAPVSLVFTTPTGGLVLRQTVAKVVKQAAKTAGVGADLSTRSGRRTVVTSLYVDGGEASDDIARYVGHAKASTTTGYVKRLGQRPASVAKRAAELLDGQADDENDEARNRSAGLGSNGGSNDAASTDEGGER